MDQFEAARIKQAKNKERRERQAQEQKAVVEVEVIEIPKPAPAPKTGMGEGDIRVELVIGGRRMEFLFNAQLMGNIQPHLIQQLLLEALAQKFGRRVFAK